MKFVLIDRWLLVSVALALMPLASSASALPRTIHVGPSKADCDQGRISDAISAASNGDTILIDAAGTYSAQHLNISNKSLIIGTGPCKLIVGGRPDGTEASAQATVTGDSSGSAPVIAIVEASVVLNDLKITGNTYTYEGGGINVYGETAKLTLNNVILTGNKADGGGGVAAVKAKLVLGSDTQIVGNTAIGDGGGILLQLGATMTAAGTGNLIANNHALNGSGGGLLVYASTATITASGIGTFPLFTLNDAKTGGGIALQGEAGRTSSLVLGDVNGTPIVIDNNLATEHGGGISAEGQGANSANISAFNTRITRNGAPDGAALFSGCLDLQSCQVPNTIGMESEGCAVGACSAILDNVAGDGAVISATRTLLNVSGTRLSGNSGKRLLVTSPPSTVSASESLFSDNDTPQYLLYVDGTLELSQCTFSGNSVTLGYATIAATSGITITNTVIDSAATAVKLFAGTPIAHGVVGTNITGLSPANDVVLADPVFVDAPHGDYRLRASTTAKNATPVVSPAIDFANAGPTTQDIDGRMRPKDFSGAVNKFGTYDLGAFEMQPITDRLFANGIGDPYLLAK